MSANYPEIAARFARETRNHRLEVRHDDGLYRHLVLADPTGGFYRFDLITWPHNVFLRGDGFSFGFAVYPTEDMFDVFRGSRSGGINPGYWQEKVTAGKVRDWSEDLFRAWVLDEAAKNENRYPGAVEAVTKQILHSDEHSTEYQGTAEYALANFRHGDFRLRFPHSLALSIHDDLGAFEAWREALDIDPNEVRRNTQSADTTLVLSASATVADARVELIGYAPNLALVATAVA